MMRNEGDLINAAWSDPGCHRASALFRAVAICGKRPPVRCSGCEKRQDEARIIIALPREVYLCERCIELLAIVARKPAEQARAAS